MEEVFGGLAILFAIWIVCEILWFIVQFVFAGVIFFCEALLMPFFFYLTPAVLIILALAATYWGAWIASKNYFLSLKANIVSHGFAGALTRKYIISVLTLFLAAICLSLAYNSALFIRPQGEKFLSHVDEHYKSIQFPEFTIHSLFGNSWMNPSFLINKTTLEKSEAISEKNIEPEKSQSLEILYVSTEQMKLRAGAGTEYSEIGRIFYRDAVVVIENAVSAGGGNWVKVKVGNLEGWLNRKYLSTTQPVEKQADLPAQSATVATTEFSPSFDCAKAGKDSERLICSNANLAATDIEMVQIYKEALKNTNNIKTLKTEQNHWRKTYRDTCTDVDCISNAYTERIRQLKEFDKNTS